MGSLALPSNGLSWWDWLQGALLLPTTMAIALGDVIVDALMVEKGQLLGRTGHFTATFAVSAANHNVFPGQVVTQARSALRM